MRIKWEQHLIKQLLCAIAVVWGAMLQSLGEARSCWSGLRLPSTRTCVFSLALALRDLWSPCFTVFSPLFPYHWNENSNASAFLMKEVPQLFQRSTYPAVQLLVMYHVGIVLAPAVWVKHHLNCRLGEGSAV